MSASKRKATKARATAGMINPNCGREGYLSPTELGRRIRFLEARNPKDRAKPRNVRKLEGYKVMMLTLYGIKGVAEFRRAR